jgi:hypothetical protein
MPTEARPFLPEPDPPEPPKKSNAKRTLLLWVLLIFIFLAIWQFLSPASTPPSHASEPRMCPCDDAGWTSSAWYSLPTVGVFAIVFLVMRQFRAPLAFNASQEGAMLAFAQRRFAEATELYRSTAATLSKTPLYQAVGNYNLAYAELWAGRLEDAIQTLARVERTFGSPRATGVRFLAANTLILANGLAGDLDTAERWADDTRKRIAKTADSRLNAASQLCLGEAVVALRRGRVADALTSLESNWLSLRHGLNANTMRIAEILRAFAEAHGGVREYNTVGERLIRVEPVSTHEFAFLGVRWPEMQEFLVAHRLASP